MKCGDTVCIQHHVHIENDKAIVTRLKQTQYEITTIEAVYIDGRVRVRSGDVWTIKTAPVNSVHNDVHYKWVTVS